MATKAVKVDLDEDMERDLEKIRVFLGVKNNTEVIRILIREKARDINET